MGNPKLDPIIAIERRIEAKFNTLDGKLMRGEISQKQYDAECRRIDNRAELEYRTLIRRREGW